LIGTLLALAVLLFGVQEFFRRTGKGAAWGCFLVLPSLLTASWDIVGPWGLFPWVKTYSMLVLACWLTGVRFTALGLRRWARFGAIVLAALNILEAIVKDLSGGCPAHYLNAASGVFLLVTFPFRLDAVEIDTGGGQRDIHYNGLSRLWIVGYTLWNGVFVYLNYPALTGHELAVLASALAVGLVEPRRWGQARVYTLATDLLLLAIFPWLRTGWWMDTSSWSSPLGEGLVPAANLVFMALYTARFATASLSRRAETGLVSLGLPEQSVRLTRCFPGGFLPKDGTMSPCSS
jgi:hypothetical protein